MKQGVSQGSVLGLLLFIIHINDLPVCVKHVSKAMLFADDTSVIVTDKDHDDFKQKTKLALTSLNQWFYTIQLVLSVTKTNLIKFTPKTTEHSICRYADRQSYELGKQSSTNSSKIECCMLWAAGV